MSDTYKTISKARKTAKALLEDPNPRWKKSGIVKEMGVTFSLYDEIMNYDPVTVADKIRQPTLEKLKSFIGKHGHHLNEIPKRPDPPHPVASSYKPPKDPDPPKSILPHIPQGEGEDLLARLNELALKFQRRGYRLGIRIENMYMSENPES